MDLVKRDIKGVGLRGRCLALATPKGIQGNFTVIPTTHSHMQRYGTLFPGPVKPRQINTI